MSEHEQHLLPGIQKVPERWQHEWVGMPEFAQDDLTSHRKIVVHFRNDADVREFAELIGQRITPRQPSLWYPEMEPRRYAHLLYTCTDPDREIPRYPIYIVSKGRWDTRLTSKSLERMGVDYKIVVEPSEYAQYAAVIDRDKILVLPENFSELGQGSIPARNWIWEHSIANDAVRHWILDDNIEQFNRLANNLQVMVDSGVVFRCAEDFVDRYENVALAGFQYDFFAKARTVLPAFALNTRIYSCILIKNDIPYRWRGRYNEDTDLSIRVLKDGWVTVLFYAFIQQKAQTMTMRGGNTDTIYDTDDGRYEFAMSVVKQHPDVARLTRKFGRWHHHVDYRPFRNNELRRKEGLAEIGCVDNYGMILVEREASGDNNLDP